MLGLALTLLSTMMLIRTILRRASLASRAASVGIATLSWCILYVLSFGPVLAVVKRSPPTTEVLRTVYAPVIWLHRNANTLIRDSLEEYDSMWGRKAEEFAEELTQRP
jgi:hypothetical protein